MKLFTNTPKAPAASEIEARIGQLTDRIDQLSALTAEWTGRLAEALAVDDAKAEGIARQTLAALEADRLALPAAVAALRGALFDARQKELTAAEASAMQTLEKELPGIQRAAQDLGEAVAAYREAVHASADRLEASGIPAGLIRKAVPDTQGRGAVSLESLANVMASAPAALVASLRGQLAVTVRDRQVALSELLRQAGRS